MGFAKLTNARRQPGRPQLNRCSLAQWMIGLCVILLVAGSHQAFAQEAGESNQPGVGRSIQALIDEYRKIGFPFVYSTNLVDQSLEIQATPSASDPVEIIREVLRPYRLEIRELEDVLLIARSPEASNSTERDQATVYFILRAADTGHPIDTASFTANIPLADSEQLGRGTYRVEVPANQPINIGLVAEGFLPLSHSLNLPVATSEVLSLEMILGPAELSDINISTSRYRLSRELLNSMLFFDQRAIQVLPDFGEDPLRAVHRLPGVAAGGWSAKSHFRGGEENETAIFLNGLRLLDPFHIRDYQSIFSTIDVRAIEGIEVYTGGFPVAYGDRMSGLVLIDSQEPGKPLHTELGISIFNTSILNSGYSEERQLDWLVSGRSSNLDLVLDQSVGEPSYYDIFAQAGWQLSPETRLSINALSAGDSVLVITESDPEELEESLSDTRNFHLWARLDNSWTPRLSSSTLFSNSNFRNARIASIQFPEVMIAEVVDIRKVDSLALRQDWRFDASASHLVQWGISAEKFRAVYDYQGAADYFGFRAAFAGQPESVERSVQSRPSGNSYGLYISDRWQFTENTTAELGLRWDKQTYTNTGPDDQLSPRFSLLHSVNKKLDLRFSWGRYSQSQGIQELQVEDGVDHFFPAQRSDHLIAGFQYRFGDFYALRVEAFHKDFSRLKPRFENLHDPLALIPELQPDRVMVAPQSSRSYGVEMSVDYRGPEELDWWASYTLSRATDRENGTTVPRSWDQRHSLQAGLGWSNGPWEVGVAIAYHTGWPITGLDLEVLGDEEYVLTPGLRNADRLGNFSSIDMRIGREFAVKRGKLTAFFEISNALNSNNPCCADYDITEGSDDEILIDKSIDNWLPLLPAIGVLWEF